MTKELAALNANPDRQVSPVLKPIKEPGLVDLELKTTDRLPGHAKLSADNRGPITTPRNRLLAEAQYTNLWDREHIVTVQTVQTPTDWGAVQTYGFTYAAPLPNEQLAALYFAKTMSNSVLAGTALPAGAGGDIGIAGNATVTGVRYTVPFKALGPFRHQVTLGLDYKRLEKTTAMFPSGLGTAVVLSTIQYTPMSLSYSGYIQDRYGVTSASSGIKGYAAGMIPGGDTEDFGGNPNDPLNQPGNRKGSTGNFIVLQGSLERFQLLPEEFSVTAHADGQWANEPLIPAEEYFAGGLDTVRGYQQFEAIGDNAVRARLEGLSPAFPIAFDRTVAPRLKLDVKFAAFYDAAFLWVRRPQPGQTDRFQLEGVGGGIRALLSPFNLKLHLDQGFALRNAVVTKKGDSFVHFAVEIGF
jgi:hemolysin activation/secretion protein